MHEQSLMNRLLEQVEEIRLERKADRVVEIQVEVGPLSGVDPVLLSLAFERSKNGATFQDAKFTIVEIPLLANCQNCEKEFKLAEFKFRCPECSSHLRLLQGDGIHLTELTFAKAEKVGLSAGEKNQHPI